MRWSAMPSLRAGASTDVQARRTRRFDRELAGAPPPIQQTFEKQLALLLSNPRHPSLRARKYDEARGIWQARVTGVSTSPSRPARICSAPSARIPNKNAGDIATYRKRIRPGFFFLTPSSHRDRATKAPARAREPGNVAVPRPRVPARVLR